MTPEEAESLCNKLLSGVEAAGSELGRDGWAFDECTPRFLMRTHLPVVAFRAEGKTLCFIVTPKDPSTPAYKRTANYDLVYYSEDVPDNQQSAIYRRDRDFIDRFAGWLQRWDS